MNGLRQRVALAILGVSVLSGCTLPRGAAVQGEVLRGIEETNADFTVLPITRDTVRAVEAWPNVARHDDYAWPSGHRYGVGQIAPGDIINLVIWDSNPTSLFVAPGVRSVAMTGLRVSSLGDVYLPYVGNVRIAGQTLDVARRTVNSRVASVSPTAVVQLAIAEGEGNRVRLVSGVGSPGSYPLVDGGHTVLGLIAQGGGVQGGLRNPRIILHRGLKRYSISLEYLRDHPKFDVYLRPGDNVFVEEDNRSFQVLGASGSEQVFYFDRDDISAREAVAMAGGLDDNRANPKSVLILREYPLSAVGKGPKKDRVVFVIDLTTADGLFSADRFPIAPDDLVLVTESPVNSTRTLLNLIGSGFGLARQTQGL